MCRMKTITPPYQTDIHSAGELKQQLVQVWCSFDQDVRPLHKGVKHFQHVFMRRALISSISCELTHSDRVWLVLCDWLAQIFCTLL